MAGALHRAERVGFPSDTAARLNGIDWAAVRDDLEAQGVARIAKLLRPADCREVAGWYDEAQRFRSHIVMARHRFGCGDYKYFADPLPLLVADLRAAAYAGLVPLAREWALRTGRPQSYPADHVAYRALCAAAGQTRPTPLLLRYEEGGYNCLHQDLYGELVFPIQMAVLLSQPGTAEAGGAFEGGEFALVEQRPRQQSRVEVVPLEQGDAVCFPVHDRPVMGTRGYYRVVMRHGVSRVRRGQRVTLGIILHDAR